MFWARRIINDDFHIFHLGNKLNFNLWDMFCPEYKNTMANEPLSCANAL